MAVDDDWHDQYEETRFTWAVRNSDDEEWMLLTYRWHSRQDALESSDHWLCHYKQVQTVEVFTKWRVIT